ncbi:Cof-like hydrolase, HAD-superfamily, subfamily IIB, related [Eimeria maxima]|uniref:Cof-like hydrolase, HAD-superfamily, subfamily IIB, related n=1 Tax=Eimeria maxima TaxID=5804 RepID=U6M1P8_EIMMA|nr:Cof-like hydrolase, HAD-superfamily, subfamily IIB, related [Eimeria maxima]CDJ57013.1 Cof-like hydrolase, HAD-superfamily, subfamily IIB, related [Eimeria maxima]
MALRRVLLCLSLALGSLFGPAISVSVQKTHFPHRDRPIRLIVVDVDGTLTTGEGVFSTRNIEGFKRAKELGIEIAFATGKDPKATEDVIGSDTLQEIGYFGFPGVFVNGAYVVDRDGDIIADGPLTKGQKERLLRSFSAHGLDNVSFGKTPPGPVLGTRDDTYTGQYRAVVRDDPSKLDAVLPPLREEFGGEIGFTRWADRAFSAHRAEFTKGTGLLQLSSRLNIDCEDVLALGNADNDLPMFKEAGVAVCVGDGDDVAKEAADYITVNSSEGALSAVLQEIEKLGYYPHKPEQPEKAQ